ncbi:uncharacterized protein LOC121622867 isoform X3 [Chelmon rostratus]|uniref:uncharacterized protein LOC121622867 isoform X3 n=1 Tax=Chelmon rostratus TaxID=109905 RepID=UPI001BE8AA20|nr:uncharacterized protein LOC121622867 isoform X3 [Chelmon rostratus]
MSVAVLRHLPACRESVPAEISAAFYCFSPGEGDSWKDELLELARSKHELNMSELRCLLQVCENQQNDLQLLQLNLESARETLREKAGQRLPASPDELRRGCLDNRSPSSLRMKNSRLSHDAANLQGTVSGDLGVSSAHSMDGEDPLSSSSLQQLLQESIMASSEHSSSRPHSSVNNSGTTDPLCSHKCQTCHHHPATSTYKASETPPEACPRHGASQTCGRLNGD